MSNIIKDIALALRVRGGITLTDKPLKYLASMSGYEHATRIDELPETYEFDVDSTHNLNTISIMLTSLEAEKFRVDQDVNNVHIGFWVDDGILYGDLSVNFEDEEECREFAIKNKQIAYYDSIEDVVVYVR